MPIDTSMYSTHFNPPANPLDTVQKYAATKQTLGQNQLLQNEIGAQQELGDIISQSTDNDTGILDYNKALALSGRSKFGGINARKLIELKNSQDDPSQIFNQATGKNELRRRQDLQRIAAQQGSPAPNPMENALNTPGRAPVDSANDNQLTGGGNQDQNPENPPQSDQNPGGQQLSQEDIDALHEHNQHIIKTLDPLVKDRNVDHKKVIGAVADLVANPAVNFNATDGATALSNIPFGPGGQPPDSNQIHAGLKPILDQQLQHEANLQQHLPSSRQLAERAAPVHLSTDPNSGISFTPPPGYTSPQVKSRENYDEVVDTAKSAPQTNAAYEEAINLNNAGAPTGTSIANMYQWAAKNVPGISPGVTDKAAQAQEIGKWMSQGLIANGMPASDARLHELQHANLNPDQLSQTIKELAPFFKAVAKGTVAKQNFYNKITKNGTDLSNEPEALQLWNNNYDPRWVEFDSLKNKKDQRQFLSKHSDLIDKRDHYHALQDMGVVSGQ